MKRLFKFKYPKLTLLLSFFIFSYLIFTNETIQSKVEGLEDLRYLGMFLAGLFFSFGFSTPFAVGFFLIVNPTNVWLATLIGALGALLSDLFIFKMIKLSFMDEFRQLEKSHPIKSLARLFKKHVHFKISNYLLYACAGIIIASPLPDEIGVSMLAGLTSIKINKLAAISFIMNFLGILFMLLLGKTF